MIPPPKSAREEQIDIDSAKLTLSRCLNNSWYSKAAEWFYKTMAQPLSYWLESMPKRWTQKWCQDRIPATER